MIRELEGALDALARRQRVVAHNLANIDTPQFTRSDIDFFGHMKGVFTGGDTPIEQAEVKEDKLTAVRFDGNNVSLEAEMYALTQTDLLYQAASKFTSAEITRLRYAITEGKG